VSQDPLDKSTSTSLAELADLLGPPPVLSTENVKAYDEVKARLMQCFAPRDFMEQLLIKQVTDCTWEIKRYTRHMTLAIERKFYQLREFQAKRAAALTHMKDPNICNAGRDGHAETDAGLTNEIQTRAASAMEDVAAPIDVAPLELDHAQALEAGIEYHGQLDQLLNSAVARRNNAFDQLERYRHGWGKRLRRVSDEIIDAEFIEAAPQSKDVAVSLAPSNEGANDV
jgi:hypothetical protein